MAYETLTPSKNLVGTNPMPSGYSEAVNQGLEDPISPYSQSRIGADSTSPVSVISTAQAKSNLQGLEADHTLDMNRLTVEENNKKVNEDKFRQAAEANDRRNGGLSAEELSSLGGNMGDYTFSSSSGLYIPKATQVNQPKDASQLLQDEIDKVFSQQEGLIDASTNAQMSSIRQTYANLAKEQREANEASKKSFRSFGVRSGLSRYSGETAAGMENAIISSGLKSLSKIASEEFKTLAQAESARAQNKYTLFAKKRDELVALRKERQDKLDKIQEEIQKKKDEAQKIKIQASREGAIAGLVAQGITDPKQILQYVNYDDNGNLIGDITSKEIADTLKNLSPDSSIEKLSGSTRDFFILKGMGQLPADVAALPEDKQLFAYLAAEKRASSLPKTGSTGNKITFTEASSKGLPISTVGMTEDQLAESFMQPTPPPWFVEKMQAETNSKGDKATIPGKMSLANDSETIKSAWEDYRNVFNAGGKADKKSTNYEKASQYFGESYEGLTDDQIDQLATQVETYVNGGKSYADAIEQTIKDID